MRLAVVDFGVVVGLGFDVGVLLLVTLVPFNSSGSKASSRETSMATSVAGLPGSLLGRYSICPSAPFFRNSGRRQWR